MPPAVAPDWLTLLVMSPQRRYQRPAALAILLCGALLSGCDSAPGPQAEADAYLAAWARQDWAAMQKLTSGPPAGLMASVVARGTAAGQGLPPGTNAKTGTAQYGTTKALKLDAWLMGFNGDIAFAALVVDAGGNGGPVCGPIVAKFLRGL
jgi:Penicillin binding protein transpeptidase domain